MEVAVDVACHLNSSLRNHITGNGLFLVHLSGNIDTKLIRKTLVIIHPKAIHPCIE